MVFFFIRNLVKSFLKEKRKIKIQSKSKFYKDKTNIIEGNNVVQNKLFRNNKEQLDAKEKINKQSSR